MRSARFFASLLALAACVFSATTARAVTPIFLVDGEAGSQSNVFRVDPASGQLTLLGTLPAEYGEAVGLAAASEDLLYVTTSASPVANRVLRVVVSPFSFQELGAVARSFSGIAFDGGQLYGIDEFNDGLYRIQFNTQPIEAVLIGTVRMGSPAGPVLDLDGGDIAQDAGGNWYLWTNTPSDLYSLDINTAVAVQLDPTTFGPKTGLAFNYQGGGTLYGSSRFNDTFETIDRTTGATTASVGFCLNCPTVYDHRFGDLASPRCTDVDNDGFSPEATGCGPVDCDDTNPNRFPTQNERCNGVDDDCDGAVDEEPVASASCATACTAIAVCQAGACVTTPVVCDDSNPCTSDACDPMSGCTFANQPNGLSCSDGNVCTGEEVCSNGMCTNAPDLDCGDGNGCTVDSCAPPNGCRNLPISGCCTTNADCADASACTQNERCVAGQCLSDPVSCDDGNSCTNDSCSPTGGCANIPVVNGISCGDGNVCNGQETCQNGMCAAGTTLNCSDGNACTTDGCNPQTGCTQQPTPGCCTIDADCADGSACTINERCVANVCVSDPLACNDNNPCTGDSCNPAGGCTFTPVPNGQSCSNLDFCDGLETCQSGTCTGSAPPNCNDGNPCTTDTCNGNVGCTHAGVAGCCFTDGDCADADACTINSRCVANTCQSDARNCNDGNGCTTDGCDPAIGCTNTPVIDGTGCADQSVCDGAETCTGGACQEGIPPNCDDANFCTQDRCDNATGCRHDPIASCCNTDPECADSDNCTTVERCTAQHTCATTPRTCVDGITCTADSCDPAVGCVFTPATGAPCDDGDACTMSDTCSAGICAGSPRDCSDGNACNGAESCVPGTGSCVGTAGPLVCTPGSTQMDRTCAAEWYVRNPNNLRGVLSIRQSCVQGDRSCDQDNDPETCTFDLSVCLRVPDARLAPACTLDEIIKYSIRRPKVRTDPVTTGALYSALGTLPGAVLDDPRGRDVRFEPKLGQTACTPSLAVPVPIGARLVFRTRTAFASGVVDLDTLRLECLP
jgi:hypothetical protein